MSWELKALDNSGNPFAATGTATIDDYVSAFVQPVSSPPDQFQLVPKITLAPGAPSQTVNITYHMTDSFSGQEIPPFTFSVDLVGPPPPPKATHLGVTSGPFVGAGSDVSDPGSNTVAVSLT